MQTFEVKRDALDKWRLREATAPEAGEGEVLLHVDRFAFTANNITYAVFGEAMHYWDFFPAAEPGWGVVPVWGFADVVESRCDGIEVGERFYGYYPMGTHLLVRPDKVATWGFADASAHRTQLPEVYNRYARCSADPGYRQELEAWQMLFRPLFLTAFLLDDFLAEEGFFGASRVVLTSASSKTGFSLAFLLERRRDADVRIIGMTSPGNRDFVSGLGCYHDVLAYDEVGELAGDEPAVLVDFAGSAELRRRVHETLDDSLRYSCSVGASHWHEAGGGDDLPGPRPVLFFAPDRARKRAADWGPAGIETRVAGAWQAFLEASSSWLKVREDAGPEAVASVYAETLAGRMSAQVGQILSLE